MYTIWLKLNWDIKISKLLSKLSLKYTSLSVIFLSILSYLFLKISSSIYLSSTLLSTINYLISIFISILSKLHLIILVLSLSLSFNLLNKSVSKSLISIFLFTYIYQLSIKINSNLFVDAQLIINLKNRGEEIFQEAISSNVQEDLIEVEYRNTDDSLVTQLIDFRNNLVLFRLILLNEQDILDDGGDNQKYQRLCYVTLLNRSEYISSDDIHKLRQRNPSEIREPENDKGKEIVHMNYKLNLKESKQLSSHINRLCTALGQESSSQIYIRKEDLLILAPNLMKSELDDDDDEDNFKDNRKIENDLKDKSNDKNFIVENMKNRCFMQKFQQTFLQQKNQLIKNNQLDNLSNYERLKIRLKKQMMPKINNSINKLTTFKNEMSLKNIYLNNKKDNLTNKLINNENLKINNNDKLSNIIYGKLSFNQQKSTSCYCKIEICIPWYPCTVKYCRVSTTTIKSIDLNKQNQTYNNDQIKSDRVRCGIRSCKKCWLFYYVVENKKYCLWDYMN